MKLPNPPKTIEELQSRIDAVAGLSLGEIAEELQVAVPENLLVDKGWSGQLLEAYLGATAGNLPEPDFQELGIELKTLPINAEGKPLETTFVCVAPLLLAAGHQWQDSGVYKKLRHVLWVPIIAERHIPVPDRQIAMPFLWQMDAKSEQKLQQDWLELTEFIVMGEHDKITAHHGEVIQLRPKAADSSIRTAAISNDGSPTMAPPKGFYLRSQFTHELLKQQFNLD
ncbi:DNA mismatch repair endonuclease MutH [Psychrosphaera haliotis]|uniref:DNA mismatch repair endonuclease MutH n=1 Tax=Psychrosphaera haliotis TaxID=555083 RepID=UPI0031D8EE91